MNEYGYTVKNGKMIAETNEAKIIQTIFKVYLDSDSMNKVADYLFSKSIESPGKKEKWTRSTIRRILSDKKFLGGMPIIRK